ncbi:MAG: hypothetical protein Q9163_002571 [Psora crenata]
MDNSRSQKLPTIEDTKCLENALSNAIGASQLSTISHLLDQGVKPHAHMYLPILKKQDAEKTIAMLQLFLNHGWDINGKTELGSKILKYTLHDKRLTQWLLEHGADPNGFDKIGSTILDVAAANSTPEIFDLLLEHGAKLEESDTLLSAAMSPGRNLGRLEMMQHLLDLGTDIDGLWRRQFPPTRRRPRGTALHAAVISQDRDRILLLLKSGANREAKNEVGQTPLQYATAKGLTKSIEVLNEH